MGGSVSFIIQNPLSLGKLINCIAESSGGLFRVYMNFSNIKSDVVTKAKDKQYDIL